MALPSNYIDGNVIVDDDGCFTFTVGSSALVAGTFVTLNSQGLIDACAVGGTAIGYVAEAFAASAVCQVYPLCRGQRLKVVAGGAIAVGDLVKLTTGGKVVAETTPTTTRTVNTVGVCSLATSSDGDLTYIYIG